jgi:hypothetical protein
MGISSVDDLPRLAFIHLMAVWLQNLQNKAKIQLFFGYGFFPLF